MKTGGQIQVIVVLVVGIVVVNCEVCRPFNNTQLNQACGYNYTAKFQYEQHYRGARRAIEVFTTRRPNNYYKLYNCSAFADLMVCSLYLPKCVEGINKPVLPCREVCEEFIQGCKDRLLRLNLEWVIGMCTVLPKGFDSNGKRNTEECFLPPKFVRTTTEYTNPECFPMTVPACSGLGYKYTILTQRTQNAYSGYMNRTIMAYSRKNHTNPTCVYKMRKLICAESVPPCFDNKMHYNCRDECENIYNNCSKHFWYGRDMCIEFPRGERHEGYCPQSEWPRSDNWPDFKPPTVATTLAASKPPTGSTLSPNDSREPGSKGKAPADGITKKDKGPQAAAASTATGVSAGTVAGIAVAVLVAIATAAVISLFLYKRHKARTTGYQKHAPYEYEDDTVQFDL